MVLSTGGRHGNGPKRGRTPGAVDDGAGLSVQVKQLQFCSGNLLLELLAGVTEVLGFDLTFHVIEGIDPYPARIAEDIEIGGLVH